MGNLICSTKNVRVSATLEIMNLNRTHLQCCSNCGRKFKTDANRQVFCSIECRLWWEVFKRSPSECWPWIGATDRDGYGRFRWKYRMLRAHSVAFRITHPNVDTPCVLHSCDTPSCCNPKHLFGGTQADNVADRNRKGRTRANPRAGDNGRNSPRNALGQFSTRKSMCGV